MPARKLPEDYHELAESKGIKWLGPRVSNIKTKTWWECKEGHKWEAVYSNIYYQGSGCPACVGNLPKIPKDYCALASARKFKWVGPVVHATNVKTWWECERQHQWEATYSNIRSGWGCPHCSKIFPKTPKDYHALAKNRNLEWLGPEVSNTATKTAWQCSEGHKWEATYNNIRNGSGCPFCADCIPKIPRDYYVLARKRNFKWIGPEISNTKVKTIAFSEEMDVHIALIRFLKAQMIIMFWQMRGGLYG